MMLWAERCWRRAPADGRYALCGKPAVGWDALGALVCSEHGPLMMLGMFPEGPALAVIEGRRLAQEGESSGLRNILVG